MPEASLTGVTMHLLSTLLGVLAKRDTETVRLMATILDLALAESETEQEIVDRGLALRMVRLSIETTHG
jgi:hypothetical protein